jgi:hypothetical protein
MIYSRAPLGCSGNCSGLASIRLSVCHPASELQTLESPLHRLGRWVDITLRNDDAAVPRNPHDGKSIHSRFTKPCQHCMAQRVEHKVTPEHGDPLTFKPLARAHSGGDDSGWCPGRAGHPGWQRRMEQTWTSPACATSQPRDQSAGPPGARSCFCPPARAGILAVCARKVAGISSPLPPRAALDPELHI